MGVEEVGRLPVQQDRAAVRRIDSGDDLHQGAFAGSVLPHDPVNFSIVEGDGYALQSPNPAEMLGDIFHFQHNFDLIVRI